MVNALVIGGTGFIGSRVVGALVEQGCAVTVYARGIMTAALPAGVATLNASIDRLEPWPSPLPDVVIHMIAMNCEDGAAAARVFGQAGRLVAVSSGDVYRAYGRFIGLEPGPPEPMPLTEQSPLRDRLFPYRPQAASEADPLFSYEKILMEREILAQPSGTVVRLPKVYGPGRNADFGTVHGFANQPHWRWTHGYVENVAAAIALVALHPELPRRVYNIGEASTPTVAERLRDLPASPIQPGDPSGFDFSQDIVLDSGAIRAELGYVEPVHYAEGIARTLAGS